MRNHYFENVKIYKEFNSHSYISLKNKYYFHSIGKAANSTVKHYLYTQELIGSGLKYKTVHDRLNSPLVSPYQLSDDLLSSVMSGDEYFRFTFVRNPFSRLLSCYLDRLQDKKSAPYKEFMRYAQSLGIIQQPSFSDFINVICTQSDKEQNNHWRVQYSDAMCAAVEYDFIGKQENFALDMTKVWRIIFGAEKSEKDFQENKSPSKTGSSEAIKSFWSDDLIELVVQRYSQDFDYFNYSKKPF